MRPLAALALFTAIFGTAAHGIVIRHDVEPDAYLASEAGFPQLFALYRTKEGHRDCIATLIAPQWAVTAAHCTEDAPFVAAVAASGHKVEASGAEAMIDRVVRHPEGENGRTVDLALVHLSAPVAVQPMQVYRASDEFGRTVLLPGWGGSGNGLDGLAPGDGLFRIAENRIDAARDGWLIWEFDDPRSGTGRALAMEGISGPGDSGGPALVMTPHGLAIAGVSAAQRTYGRAEGLYGADEYYVRLSDYAGWIDSIVNES